MGKITMKTYTMVILHIKTAMLYNETMKTTQILFIVYCDYTKNVLNLVNLRDLLSGILRFIP